MDKIIEHNGKKYRPIKNDSKESSDCSFCDIGDNGDKCGFLSQCKTFYYYKEIKENNMKKSELSFKVLTMDRKRTDKIIAALEKAGIECEKGAIEAMAFEIKSGNLEYWTSPFDEDCEKFDDSPMQEVPLKDALKLIESIEPDAPEFDIKPFDRILARGANGSEWLARHYEAKGNCNFIETGGCFCIQLIKYDGNEHLHRTTNPAAGWWECENGKPVWKTK